MPDFAAHRRNMIDNQLRPSQVTDAAVIAAFSDIPRERFVPGEMAGCAYIDDAVPLGGGRYLMEPMICGRLVQALAVKPTDRTLVVGAATGYLAAILARLTSSVVALEADAALIETAKRNLAGLSVSGVTFVRGEPKLGHDAGAPYDVVLIDGAVPEVPAALRHQLAEGGRLGAVIGGQDGVSGRAVLMFKRHGAVSHRTLFDAMTPLLPGCAPEPAFVF
jgi:protein-L-isoaspartate(D-aspartate) O-methyltransferase